MAKESIFSALRESRCETEVKEKINEEVDTNKENETEVKDTNEPGDAEVNEDLSCCESVVACPHCGILGILNEDHETELDACPYCGEEELVEKFVKVVRDGNVVKKKVKTKKTRLTPAQKAALAKARKKAHTASAEKSRMKSNKVRTKKGLNDSDYIECEECGWTGDISELIDGCCPECGLKLVGTEACGSKKKKGCKESVEDIAESLVNMSQEDLAELKEILGK